VLELAGIDVISFRGNLEPDHYIHLFSRGETVDLYSVILVFSDVIYSSAAMIIVLRPVEEFFTNMETSPLLLKGCKTYAYILGAQGL
jgi:hypothetical protein